MTQRLKLRKRMPIIDAEEFRVAEKPWPFGVEYESEFMDQDGSRLGGFHKLTTWRGFEFISDGDFVAYQDGNRRVIKKSDLANYDVIEEKP